MEKNIGKEIGMCLFYQGFGILDVVSNFWLLGEIITDEEELTKIIERGG